MANQENKFPTPGREQNFNEYQLPELDGGGAHWPEGSGSGTQSIFCELLQINIYRRVCASVRKAHRHDPHPECDTCERRPA